MSLTDSLSTGILLLGGAVLVLGSIGAFPTVALFAGVALMAVMLLANATISLASGDTRNMLWGGAVLALVGAVTGYLPGEAVYAALAVLMVVRFMKPS